MKEKVRNGIYNNGIYFAAFIIPWIVVLLHSIIRGGWLVGGGSILRGDAGSQYYQLCVELWNKVHNGESLFYSWNAGDGFDFYLNLAYYLISPFTLLVLIVPKAWIVNTVQVIMVLKWSCMATSVTYYFMHTRLNHIRKNKHMISLVLGCVFALSNCIVNFVTYFNWGDVIILFPLLLLQLENILDNGRWKKYYLMLTLAMLCNFYTAYQVCIFLLLWFCVLINKETTYKVKKFFAFAGSSVLAAISSLVVIIPCLLGVTNRYSFDITYENKGYARMLLTGILEAISKLFVFDTIEDTMSLNPNLYISIGALVVLLLYVFVKEQRIHKAKMIMLFVVLLASVFVGALSFVWHGFSVPHGVYHRFLYLLVFVSCMMVMEVITNIQEVTIKKVAVMAFLETFGIVIGFFHVSVYLEFYTYLATVLLFVFYQIMLVLLCRKSIKVSQYLIVISILIVGELTANAVYVFSAYNIDTIDDVFYDHDTSKVAERVKLQAGERIQMLHCIRNMGMVETMPSDEIFVSYCNGQNVFLHQNLGGTYGDNAAYAISGGSPLINLMFNIRYGTSITPCNFSDAEPVATEGKVSLYRMKRLAGLGYMVDDDILNWQGLTAGPIESQNQFVTCAVDGDDIFEVIRPQLNCSNMLGELEVNKDYEQGGYYYYEYEVQVPNGKEYTAAIFTVDEDMDLYVVTNSSNPAQVGVKLDDKVLCYDEQQQKQQTIHIGDVKKGQQIVIYSSYDVELGEDNIVWYQFAKFNEDNYAKAYEKLSKNVYNVEQMDSTYVKGNITVEQDGIMMTSIQAMDGFTVYVDGEQIEYKKVADTMIGVPLKKGKHVVEFRYQTPYFVQGAIGSLIGIFIFACICLYDKFRKKGKQ